MKKNIRKASMAAALAALLLASPAAAAAGEVYDAAAALAAGPSRRVADYSGAGSFVAILDAGFDTDHLAFAKAPSARRLTEADCGEYYLSGKIPFACDYADGDTDVASSVSGTAAASVAAGYMPGSGDVKQEDGTVLHDFSFSGAAPDAQLALMKIVPDNGYMADEDAFLKALSDAVAFGADAVLVHARTAQKAVQRRERLVAAVQAQGQKRPYRLCLRPLDDAGRGGRVGVDEAAHAQFDAAEIARHDEDGVAQTGFL